MTQTSALVVDDSSTSRILLTKILKKMDIHCEQAVSGEDALSQLEWFHPDFIFLDHLMPGMDGFETLKRLKASNNTRHIPVIMYTSQHAHQYYEEAHKLGAAGVISKQIDRDKLYLMLNRLCVQRDSNEDVPTVFEETQRSLNQDIEKASSNSKLLARLSTLETAYEELHEENRHLKLDLSKLSTAHEIHKAHEKSFSMPQIVVSGFLAFSLFASTFSWFTTQRIERAMSNSENQIVQMNELIDEIITLLEQHEIVQTGTEPSE